MESLFYSRSLSRNGIEAMPKDEASLEKHGGKKVQRRRRFYSSGDAHELKHGATNVYDLSRDWLNGSGVNTFEAGSLGLMVLESFLRKYEVEKSDFDILMDMGWAANEHVEIEELYDLGLFAWNLEETLLHVEEEKTADSLKEYSALLEECLQMRSYRARSNSTGSYDLKKEMKFSTTFNENIKGSGRQNSKTDISRNKKLTELNQSNNKIDVNSTEDHQVVMKHHVNKDRQNSNDEDEERTKKSFEIQEIADDIQKTSEQLNGADVSSQETIQSNKPNCESRDLSTVPLETTAWSHDHTYCLTCSTTEIEENHEKDVTIVISESRDGVVQLKPDASTEIPNKEISAPNKEEPESGANSGHMEAPYKVKPTKPESERGTAKLLDGDSPRDIQYKEVDKNNDSKATVSEDKPRDTPSIVASEELESRDACKPRDTSKKNTRRKDNRIRSEESKSDINETPETPKKKIRKGHNNEGAHKTRSRDSTKPCDSTAPRDTSASRDSTASNDSTAPRDSTALRDSTAPPDNTAPRGSTASPRISTQPSDSIKQSDSTKPRDGSETRHSSKGRSNSNQQSLSNENSVTAISPPPPNSDQSNTPSPFRRSKRTRQRTPRRLDTHYY